MTKHKKPVTPKPKRKKVEVDLTIPEVIRPQNHLTLIARGIKQVMFDMRRGYLLRKQMEIFNHKG